MRQQLAVCLRAGVGVRPTPLHGQLLPCRNAQLEHTNKQQAALVAELEAAASSLTSQLAASRQLCGTLHRFAVAHGAAYARLAAHAVELEAQYGKERSRLLHVCRHLSLQLGAALAAARPSPPGAASGGLAQQAAAVAAATLALEGMQLELAVAAKLLEAQGAESGGQALSGLPAAVEQALHQDLQGLPASVPSPMPSADTAAARSSSSSSRRGSVGPATPEASFGAAHAARRAGTPPPPASGDAPARVSAQVAAMESQLERLAHSASQALATAAAATQLQEQELAARRAVEERATALAAELEATRVRQVQERFRPVNGTGIHRQICAIHAG